MCPHPVTPISHFYTGMFLALERLIAISMAHELKKYNTSPILKFISIIKSITDVTECGHISYSWPGVSRIMPLHL